MRVLLVNPPRSPQNAILDHAPPAARPFVHRRLVGPPLGLLTLMAALPEHEVELLEMKGEYDLHPDTPPPGALLRAHLERFRPQLVGVTCIASELDASMALLRATKAWDPGVRTVAGGLHATLCPQDFDRPEMDFLCPGPALSAFRALLRALEAGEPMGRVPGIWLRGPDGLAPSARPALPCEPAGRDFVLPDRAPLKRWISTYVAGAVQHPGTYLFTSLGCPHRCSFCSIWPQHGGRYLQREVESVIAELKTLHDYPIVRFADGNTLVDPNFARRLFQRIAEEGIEKLFIMDIRADTAARHPALIELLARGGLKVAITGFESFRQEELGRYDKKLRLEHITRAIEVFHDNGIMLRGNYVVPPDYGEGDFDALAEHAASHSVAFAGYTILTPMPGTGLHRQLRDSIVDRDLSKYNLFNCVLKTRLPLGRFYERVGALWAIRRGTETV